MISSPCFGWRIYQRAYGKESTDGQPRSSESSLCSALGLRAAARAISSFNCPSAGTLSNLPRRRGCCWYTGRPTQQVPSRQLGLFALLVPASSRWRDSFQRQRTGKEETSLAVILGMIVIKESEGERGGGYSPSPEGRACL